MRILMVEDEPLVAARLQRLVREWAGPQVRLAQVSSLTEAIEHLHQHAVDGLLLDLNLQGADGFALLRRTLARGLPTVVVSAHHERALEAFELGVLDFVPKPYTPQRLQQALERLLTRAPLQAEPVLSVWRAQGVAVVAISEIRSIRSAGDGCEVHLRSGRYELIDRSLDQLSALLNGPFQRCHRCCIANLLCVRELRGGRGGRYQLILDDHSELPVGRTWLAEVRGRLAR